MCKFYRTLENVLSRALGDIIKTLPIDGAGAALKIVESISQNIKA